MPNATAKSNRTTLEEALNTGVTVTKMCNFQINNWCISETKASTKHKHQKITYRKTSQCQW